jgi:hypothetical protein
VIDCSFIGIQEVLYLGEYVGFELWVFEVAGDYGFGVTIEHLLEGISHEQHPELLPNKPLKLLAVEIAQYGPSHQLPILFIPHEEHHNLLEPLLGNPPKHMLYEQLPHQHINIPIEPLHFYQFVEALSRQMHDIEGDAELVQELF